MGVDSASAAVLKAPLVAQAAQMG
ncbi:MAG: hypothetical protein QOI50_640, partial [Pseudonocardiales bacterium]|nr:hypothetical protein [Pseudonocardiales bacterium]